MNNKYNISKKSSITFASFKILDIRIITGFALVLKLSPLRHIPKNLSIFSTNYGI